MIYYSGNPCEFCGRKSTSEGHDPCLGTLPGLMNACCGHGQTAEAYIQFMDGFCVRGEDALVIINIIKNAIILGESPHGEPGQYWRDVSLNKET